MAALTFTQRADKMYEATLPATVGVLQVKMSDMGNISLTASIDSIDAVDVGSLSGYNIICKVDIPSACAVKVVSSKNPTSASFVEE